MRHATIGLWMARLVGVLLLVGTAPARGDTRQDLVKIQKYIIDLQQQVWELQKRLDEQQAAMQTTLDGLKKQLETYQNTQAQVVQQMQVLLNEIQALKEQLRQTEAYLRSRPTPGSPPTAESSVGPPAPGDSAKKSDGKPAPDLFQIAYADYSRGQYDVAVAEFRQFIEANPKDPRVPEARYWIGECHYAKKAYLDAIVDFDSFLREYADHRLAPAAYYKKALAYLQMGRKAQAASEFRSLIWLYPDSEEAQAARSQLKQLGLEP